MAERALSFGAVASAYERFRPGYPDAVADRVLEYAVRPVRTALEIGAGTGKATRLIAGRGIAVTATDPDPGMLSELRGHVPPTVTIVQAAFEDLPPLPTFDLVFAAASLHWTRPEGRWDRVASMLGPGGVFASFGGQARLVDPDVERAVRAARAKIVPEDDIRFPDATGAMLWPGTELVASDRFTDVQQSSVVHRLSVTAGECVGLLSTVSAYLVLSEGERAEVLARILDALPDRVEVAADVVVHLARRT